MNMMKKEKQSNQSDNPNKDKDRDELKDVVNTLITDSLINTESSGSNISLKELELAKIIINEVFASRNLKSTTNLNRVEIDDISDAIMINKIFKSKMIDVKILSFMELKRSESDKPTNLISLLLSNLQAKEDEGKTSRLREYLGKRL